MDNANVMRGAERVRNLDQDAAGLLNGQLATTCEPGAKRLAVDEGHHEIHDAVGSLTHRVNRNDMGMREPGRRLRLAQEAEPDLLPKRELRRENLDRHFALEPFVAR